MPNLFTLKILYVIILFEKRFILRKVIGMNQILVTKNDKSKKVKEKKAQNPVKKVKNNRFAKVAIVGGIVLSACIIASYFLLRTPKEETRKGGVDDKKNND